MVSSVHLVHWDVAPAVNLLPWRLPPLTLSLRHIRRKTRSEYKIREVKYKTKTKNEYNININLSLEVKKRVILLQLHSAPVWTNNQTTALHSGEHWPGEIWRSSHTSCTWDSIHRSTAWAASRNHQGTERSTRHRSRNSQSGSYPRISLWWSAGKKSFDTELNE